MICDSSEMENPVYSVVNADCECNVTIAVQNAAPRRVHEDMVVIVPAPDDGGFRVSPDCVVRESEDYIAQITDQTWKLCITINAFARNVIQRIRKIPPVRRENSHARFARSIVLQFQNIRL